MLAGDPVAFSTLADVPGGIDRTTFAATGTRSAVFIPLSVERRVTGAIGFSTVRAERIWSTETTQRLKVFGGVFSQILARQLRDEAMRAASLEVQRLKDRLEAENVYLREEERERLGLAGVVGQSAAVRRVMDQIRQVAPTDSTVLLLGETGTGKELFATQIHQLGTATQARWCGSTAERSRPRSSKVSCSVGRGAPLPERCHVKWADSSWPTARRFFLTRSGTCRPRCRSSFCGSWRASD